MTAAFQNTFPSLRVGVVGAGTISHRHISAWKSLGATVIVQSPSSAPMMALRYGIDVAATFGELLPLVDVVDICSPTDTHLPIAMAAISAGRHVICEKPLARTGPDADRIVRAAADATVQLLPAHVVRFFPPYAAIKQALLAEAIGEVRTLRFSRGGAGPALPGTWFADVARSGGIVMDLMIHDLDAARWLAGEVESVHAQQNPADQDGLLAPRVGAQIALTHASGAISQLQGTWGAAGLPFRTTVEVFGDAGLLSHDTARGGALSVYPPEAHPSTTTFLDAASSADPYRDQFQEFSVALTGGPPARVTGHDGWAAVVLAEAALESIRTGQPVRIDRVAGFDQPDPVVRDDRGSG